MLIQVPVLVGSRAGEPVPSFPKGAESLWLRSLEQLFSFFFNAVQFFWMAATERDNSKIKNSKIKKISEISELWYCSNFTMWPWKLIFLTVTMWSEPPWLIPKQQHLMIQKLFAQKFRAVALDGRLECFLSGFYFVSEFSIFSTSPIGEM